MTLQIQAGAAVDGVLQSVLTQIQPAWKAHHISLYRGQQKLLTAGEPAGNVPLPNTWQVQKIPSESGETWCWPVLVRQQGWGWLVGHWDTSPRKKIVPQGELLTAHIGLIIQASPASNYPLPLPTTEEEPYQFLLNVLPIGIAITNAAGSCIYVNEYLSQQLWQMPSDEMLGWNWTDAIHPDDREQVTQSWQRAIDTPIHEYAEEYRLQRRDGAVIWVRDQALVLRNPHGDIAGFICISTDITEAKNLQTRLTTSEQKYRQIVNYQTDFLAYSLPDGTVTFANPYLYQCLGYNIKQEEIIGLTWEQAIPDAEDLQILAQKIQEITPQNPIFTHTNPIRGKQGQILYAEWINLGVFDEQGTLLMIQSIGRDITLLRQKESELRESQQQFATLLQNMPGMVYRYHPATDEQPHRFSYVSDYAEEIFELKPAQIMENPTMVWMNFTHPEDLNLLLTSIQEAVSQSAPWHCQWRTITPTGKLKWLEGRSQMRQDHKEAFWDGIVMDITKLKNTELALAENQKLLENILTNLPITIWRYQLWPDGREALPYVSTGSGDLYGIPSEQAQQNVQALWDLVVPEDVPRIRASTAESQQNLTLWQAEFRIVTPQGECKWLRGQGQPQRQPDGSTVWDSIMIDITPRKQAEIALNHWNQELEQRIQERTFILQKQAQSEGLLRLIIETIYESSDITKTLPIVLDETRATLACDRLVVYQFNPDWTGYFLAESVADGWVSVVNGAMTTLSDHCLEETQGGRFQQHYILVSNDIYQSGFSPCHIALLEQFQARAHIIVPIFLEQKLWGLLAAYQNDAPRIWQTNEIETLKHVGLHLAIALRQAELYKTSQAQVVELQKLNQLKDEFLSTVSHELRSPMHNIGMAIKMLELRLQKSGVLENSELGIERYLDILKSATQRETELINDLLDLARLNADAVDLIFAPVDIQQILSKLLPAITERTCDQNQHLNLQLPEHLCPIETHADSLERILQELLHNACKYTPKEETITLAIDCESENYYQFQVINTGVAIPPEERDRVFDNFYRIPNHDPWQYGGTGLGLALVKKLVERLHGEIHLISQNNSTEFRVNLPISSPTKGR
ncbi:serine/threonine protein kinase and signal transduction histidine kinase (STHK) with GAF and PAS/PAC sensor [Gloeomargarita lithophora Alchichica-D10]|uniref:histidine kinase n=1 Tax=Gloeomargarita lithophora Alchichica-D10 TaxID=1188229 RepID=A0A1J0AFS5_9CYAN|nr:PAS domain S-box protein [Gloeomargarita lithophora]APB34768.1 serine/threonine protein kinase and signal transduction histidine kinase (STHK) with GAF and PAS/PAC sensor [Gloeomargarita lithophora Alchichica-D10]